VKIGKQWEESNRKEERVGKEEEKGEKEKGKSW